VRVRDGRLEHANDCAGAVPFHAAELNGLANNGRIFSERVRPETICKDNDAGSLRTIILRSDKASEHWTQSHHIEIRAVHHAAIDFARLAQPENSESDDREGAKFAKAFGARLYYLDLR